MIAVRHRSQKQNVTWLMLLSPSPIDGVVISRDVEAGQTVASGFETPTLFTIAADLTQMQVVTDVDEADIGGSRRPACQLHGRCLSE